MSQAIKILKPDLKSNTLPEGNRRILIVDDEPAIAEGIKSLLAPGGDNIIPFRRSSRSVDGGKAVLNKAPAPYEVVVVNTPQAALEAVKLSLAHGRPFAMGFFDVLLGADIDGIELVKQVQGLDPHIFAVFVTAYHDRSVDSINEFLGEDKSDRWDYINKPFTDGEIIQKARNVLALWNLQRVKEWQDEQLSEVQRLLLQNERANTVAAVGRGVAHEFGNLLMQIVGHAELAVMKNEPKRMKEALDTILKASDTATEVLTKFKKLAQGGQQKADLKLVNMCQPVTEALDLMSYQFRKSLISVNKLKMEQVLLEANRHSLIQVFMNLFINASHAMPQGGDINISVEKAEGDANWVEVKIRDHGHGIPEDILPNVTEALFTTKGPMGSGLGLSICKEIIEIEHHGEFFVSNHPDGGVEVKLRLPTRQEVDDEHDKT